MPAAATLALASAACTGGGRAPAGPPVDRLGSAFTYVAIGASETVGVGTDDPLRQAWTQILYRTAMPRNATFVNLGIPGATVAEALADEAPQALALSPALATVWLNVNDLIAGVPPAEYEAQLDRLISTLRGGGATRVLVANTPPLDHLPAYLACHGFLPTPQGCDTTRRLPPSAVNRAVAAYNAAIARVAAKDGALLVDLQAAGLAARQAGTEDRLVSSDGFHPNPAGHLLVAETFAAALRRAWPDLLVPATR